MDLREIRRRYLRSWFVADFVAATPYDVLAVIFHDHWLGKLQVLAAWIIVTSIAPCWFQCITKI